MSKLKTSCGLAAAAVVLVLASASANAQATRTWVSGVGNDADPCSRTAPCKTFAGALAKTAIGGQISVVDPGGYGSVTIKNSISITNDNSGEAGILASGVNGVTINLSSPTDFVNLRGLIIDGGTNADPGPGLAGVRVIGTGNVTIANSVIRNFVKDPATGVSFTPNASARLTIRDTHIIRNGVDKSGGAVVIKPTGGLSSVTLTRVTMDNNSNGLVVDTTAGGAFINMLDSSANGNDNTGVALIGMGGTQSFLLMDRSAAVNNANGVTSTGANSTVMLGNSSVTGNNLGLSASGGGKITSYSSNIFDGNVSLGGVTATVPSQ